VIGAANALWRAAPSCEGGLLGIEGQYSWLTSNIDAVYLTGVVYTNNRAGTGLLRVTSGNTQVEQNRSAFLPGAAQKRTSLIDSSGPEADVEHRLCESAGVGVRNNWKTALCAGCRLAYCFTGANVALLAGTCDAKNDAALIFGVLAPAKKFFGTYRAFGLIRGRPNLQFIHSSASRFDTKSAIGISVPSDLISNSLQPPSLRRSIRQLSISSFVILISGRGINILLLHHDPFCITKVWCQNGMILAKRKIDQRHFNVRTTALPSMSPLGHFRTSKRMDPTSLLRP
jgi:hypothetical protein